MLTWLKSKGFRVSYILQPLDVDEAAGVQKLRALVDRLEIVRRPSDGGRIKILLSDAYRRFEKKFLPGRIAGWLRNAFRRAEYRNPAGNETWGTGDVGGDGHIDRWCWSATAEAVQRETRSNRPLAVITEYALLSKCLEKLPPSTLKIIDTVEVFFRNRDRFHTEGLAAPFVCTQESEQLALNRGDVLVAIQKNDAHVLRDLFPEKRVITLPHTYRQAPSGAARPATGTILYVGSSNPYNVHGLRQFRAGDSPRWIHWRTTARRGELMIREFEDMPNDHLVLIVDPGERDHPVLERLLSLAATICWDWWGFRPRRSPRAARTNYQADSDNESAWRERSPSIRRSC